MEQYWNDTRSDGMVGQSPYAIDAVRHVLSARYRMMVSHQSVRKCLNRKLDPALVNP